MIILHTLNSIFYFSLVSYHVSIVILLLLLLLKIGKYQRWNASNKSVKKHSVDEIRSRPKGKQHRLNQLLNLEKSKINFCTFSLELLL